MTEACCDGNEGGLWGMVVVGAAFCLQVRTIRIESMSFTSNTFALNPCNTVSSLSNKKSSNMLVDGHLGGLGTNQYYLLLKCELGSSFDPAQTYCLKFGSANMCNHV